MKVVIQRVSSASVTIDGKIKSQIKNGLLIFLGIEIKDTKDDSLWLANKIAALRIFADREGVMNKSITEIEGEVIVVSQFTLHAKTKKGNRPSYIKSARPQQAIPLYESFKEDLSIAICKEVKSGEFSADMKVSLTNDGPVTLIIDSRNRDL